MKGAGAGRGDLEWLVHHSASVDGRRSDGRPSGLLALEYERPIGDPHRGVVPPGVQRRRRIVPGLIVRVQRFKAMHWGGRGCRHGRVAGGFPPQGLHQERAVEHVEPVSVSGHVDPVAVGGHAGLVQVLPAIAVLVAPVLLFGAPVRDVPRVARLRAPGQVDHLDDWIQWLGHGIGRPDPIEVGRRAKRLQQECARWLQGVAPHAEEVGVHISPGRPLLLR